MEVVVDEADGAGATGGEAFCEFDRVIAAGRDGDWCGVRVCCTAVDFGRFAKLVHEFGGTGHGTRKSAADANMKFAGSRLAQTGVEGDDLDDLDGFDVELCGNPVNSGCRDVAKAMLGQVQEGQDCRALLVIRVVTDGFGSLCVQLVVSDERREVLGPRGVWGGDVFIENTLGHGSVIFLAAKRTQNPQKGRTSEEDSSSLWKGRIFCFGAWDYRS